MLDKDIALSKADFGSPSSHKYPSKNIILLSCTAFLLISLSDQFCVERHKSDFLDLVKNKLDVTFANEQEIRALINAKSFEDVIEFGKQLGKLLIITRGKKGSIAIKNQEIVECQSKPDLKIVDLTGAGDLFAAGFLHGLINNVSTKECLEKGTEMSAKIIQKVGARLD